MVRIPPFGFETLYKSDSPKDFANGEYFQVHFACEVDGASGQKVFFVREKHGYFDNDQKRLVHPITTLSPEEGFAREAEAFQRYGQQLAHRASQGFVHSFSLDPFEGMVYRRLEPITV